MDRTILNPFIIPAEIKNEVLVDDLDLSVRFANACMKFQIKTVGDLRNIDRETLGLGAKRHEVALKKACMEYLKTAPARDKERKEERLMAARFALAALTSAERNLLFRDMGTCACMEITKSVIKNPRMAVGGVIGAILAEALLSEKPKAP